MKDKIILLLNENLILLYIYLNIIYTLFIYYYLFNEFQILFS